VLGSSETYWEYTNTQSDLLEAEATPRMPCGTILVLQSECLLCPELLFDPRSSDGMAKDQSVTELLLRFAVSVSDVSGFWHVPIGKSTMTGGICQEMSGIFVTFVGNIQETSILVGVNTMVSAEDFPSTCPMIRPRLCATLAEGTSGALRGGLD
jgi:hypothetical protein